ncbi:SHOCT domain-containing protein [Erythrobacter sp.]|uniref:SHOCT domain-containing protein n=1 Tax=Erythrobacter sp. TaxID=1042 RepID=UPI0025DD8938|nr:SHOCT domain-containing protein [Erythrobacter sp.]
MSDDTDLDRLERLNRLRETGALTAEEFDAKKREILFAVKEPPAAVPRWLTWAFGIVALAALVGAAALWSRSSGTAASSSQGSALVAAAPAPEIELEPAQTAEVSAPSAAELLAFATSESIIGMTPAFLEQKLGIPKEKRPTSLVYDVGGCTITYWSEDDEVTTFFFDVARSCRVNVRGTRVGPDTTFGDILRRSDWGALTATCLANCGNAADPTIDLRYRATRLNNDIGISFSSDYDQSSDALSLWEKAVRQQRGLDEYAPTDDSDAFNCAIDPPENVERLATRLKVETVWVVQGEFGGC